MAWLHKNEATNKEKHENDFSETKHWTQDNRYYKLTVPEMIHIKTAKFNKRQTSYKKSKSALI